MLNPENDRLGIEFLTVNASALLERVAGAIKGRYFLPFPFSTLSMEVGGSSFGLCHSPLFLTLASPITFFEVLKNEEKEKNN